MKELVAASCNFYKKYIYILAKLEVKCKTSICFLFNFAWYYIQLDIVQ